MRIESTRLILNNIHNTQMVIHNLINIHKLINIHESTLFEILPGGNTAEDPPELSPHTYTLTETVSGILSIPGYSGSSRVVPPYRSPHRHSVRNTKYPGILGILPSCPPIQLPSQRQVSGILSIPGYSGFSRVVPPYRPPHRQCPEY